MQSEPGMLNLNDRTRKYNERVKEIKVVVDYRNINEISSPESEKLEHQGNVRILNNSWWSLKTITPTQYRSI